MLIDRDLTAARFERNKHQTLEASMDMGKRMLQEILEDQNTELSNAIKYEGRVSCQWKARCEPRKSLTSDAVSGLQISMQISERVLPFRSG